LGVRSHGDKPRTVLKSKRTKGGLKQESNELARLPRKILSRGNGRHGLKHGKEYIRSLRCTYGPVSSTQEKQVSKKFLRSSRRHVTSGRRDGRRGKRREGGHCSVKSCELQKFESEQEQAEAQRSALRKSKTTKPEVVP